MPRFLIASLVAAALMLAAIGRAIAAPTVADYAACQTYISPLGPCAWNSGTAPPNGETLFAVVGANVNAVITPPSGWSTLYADVGDGADCYASVGLYDKVASSEPTSNTWTVSAANINVSVVEVAVAGGAGIPLQFAPSCQTTSPLSTATLTPTFSGGLVFAGFVTGSGVTALSVASGYTLTGTTNATNGHAAMVEVGTTLTTANTAIAAVSSTPTGTLGQGDNFVIAVAPTATPTAAPSASPTASPTAAPTGTPTPSATPTPNPAFVSLASLPTPAPGTSAIIAIPSPNPLQFTAVPFTTISSAQWNSTVYKIYSDLSAVISALNTTYVCAACQASYGIGGATLGTNAHTTFGAAFTASATTTAFTLSGRAAFSSILTGECKAHNIATGAPAQAYLTSPSAVTLAALTVGAQYAWSCDGY